MQQNRSFDLTNETISSLQSRYREGILELSPAWQRGDVWSTKTKQELIISILKKIPIPAIYIHQNESTGKYEVVDGKQRLTAIFEFLSGSLEIPWKKLFDEELTDKFTNNSRTVKFVNMKENEKNSVKSYMIPLNVLRGDWDPSEKNDIVHRVQRGAKHTNGENLFSCRQNSPIIEEIARFWENFVSTYEIDDKRKNFFNVFCKMFFLYNDVLRATKPVTNVKVNKFFYKFEADQQEITRFMKFLTLFTEAFHEIQKGGLSGYLTMFAIHLKTKNVEKTRKCYLQVLEQLDVKCSPLTPQPYMVKGETVNDIINGRKQKKLTDKK